MSVLLSVLQQKDLDLSLLLDTLGFLKNISFHSEEYRQIIVLHPGLLTQLTQVPFSSSYNACNEKVVERLSAVFRNLSVSTSIRRIMPQFPDLLTATTRLINDHGNNRKITLNLLNMLISMAMEAESCLLMVFHGDGLLLSVMERLMVEESEAQIRKRAARMLRLLACETSAPLLVHDSELMKTLSKTALHDPSQQVRSEAAEAFTRCSTLIKAPSPEHHAILDALTHLAQSDFIMPEVLARAFKEQAKHPSNRVPMAERHDLLEALSEIAASMEASSRVREDACCAIFDLSREESNLSKIATPSILGALVRNAEGSSEEYSQRREYAVRALFNMASVQANLKTMACQSSLLKSLIQFAASSPGNEAKVEAKKVILKLVAAV